MIVDGRNSVGLSRLFCGQTNMFRRHAQHIASISVQFTPTPPPPLAPFPLLAMKIF